MRTRYRPWGPLRWLVDKLVGKQWSLLGTLSTEDRCTAAFGVLSANTLIASRFLKIIDPSLLPAEAFATRYQEISARFSNLGAHPEAFKQVDLLQDIDTIREELESFLERAGSDVVLDISAMPKWWFFPLIRYLLQDERVQTLVATYTSALKYASTLSSDPVRLATLPTFGNPDGRTHYDDLIVGIGFAPLGLKDLYSEQIQKVRYLFPFPPGPPNFYRNWDFLRGLETEIENRNPGREDRWHIHMYDCPAMFDALLTFTDKGNRTSVLAPYGPKTMSLAMCLFAYAVERTGRPPVPVYYTQPRRYALDYSTGVKMVDGKPDIQAYCLRIDGRDLYHL